MILSIDSGTTNTKVSLFTQSGDCQKSVSVPTPTSYPGPTMVEQQAEAWWKAAIKATRELILKKSRVNFSGIGISSQGATFVLLDNQLKPLRPAFTWLDNRADSFARDLNRIYGENFFYKKTGRCVGGWSPLCLLVWVARNEPHIWRKTYRLCFVSDYLNFKLTGRFFLDHTSAQMSCLYNIHTRTWDKELLKLAGIEEGQLPEILSACSIGGRTTRAASKSLNLPSGIPVVAGGHDQYCACLGAGAEKPGNALLSCGTAWAILLTTSRLIFVPGRKWVPGQHLLGGRCGLMGVVSEAGAVLDWMRRNLKLKPVARRKDMPVQVKVETNFSQGRGAISRLSLATTASEIYLATLQELVRKVYHLLTLVQGKVPLERIYLVGGGTREKLLPVLVEEITGREVIIPRVREAASRGAALLAIMGTSSSGSSAKRERQ